jgi:hypothetical protein
MHEAGQPRRSRRGQITDALVWGALLGASTGAVLGAAIDGVGAAAGALAGAALSFALLGQRFLTLRYEIARL